MSCSCSTARAGTAPTPSSCRPASRWRRCRRARPNSTLSSGSSLYLKERLPTACWRTTRPLSTLCPAAARHERARTYRLALLLPLDRRAGQFLGWTVLSVNKSVSRSLSSPRMALRWQPQRSSPQRLSSSGCAAERVHPAALQNMQNSTRSRSRPLPRDGSDCREVMQYLTTIAASKLSVTVEIAAEVPDGVPEAVHSLRGCSPRVNRSERTAFLNAVTSSAGLASAALRACLYSSAKGHLSWSLHFRTNS